MGANKISQTIKFPRKEKMPKHKVIVNNKTHSIDLYWDVDTQRLSIEVLDKKLVGNAIRRIGEQINEMTSIKLTLNELEIIYNAAKGWAMESMIKDVP